jgi:tRNA U38,U39,U40 pseudouridine synthase TruA
MKIFLITESGYEHQTIIDVVASEDDQVNIESLKKEFENFIGYTPTDYFKDFTPENAQSKKDQRKVAKIKMLQEQLIEDEYPDFPVDAFLEAFVNWLVKYHGFTKPGYDNVGYHNCR